MPFNTYGLKQDGIAGQKVWELLAQRELPLLQFPLELTKDQSIEGIEAKYQLAAGSLRAVNRVGRKYPGGRIYIPQRKVLALWDPKLEPNAKARGEITSIALWGWQRGERLLWTGKEELLSQDVSCLAALTLNWELLAEKKIWPKRIEAIRLGLERHGQKGLLLEINEGEGRLRRRLADFVSRLASELSGRNLWLYLKLPARKEEDPKKDRNWSLDFRALGEAAHFVVLDLSQAEEGCSFREYLEAATGYARSVLPAWKIILYCGQLQGWEPAPFQPGKRSPCQNCPFGEACRYSSKLRKNAQKELFCRGKALRLFVEIIVVAETKSHAASEELLGFQFVMGKIADPGYFRTQIERTGEMCSWACDSHKSIEAQLLFCFPHIAALGCANSQAQIAVAAALGAEVVFAAQSPAQVSAILVEAEGKDGLQGDLFVHPEVNAHTIFWVCSSKVKAHCHFHLAAGRNR